MLTLKNISKSFPGSENPVVNDFSINIPEGEFLVVIGSNGSGKSTLLNIIGGAIVADSGMINLNGNDITSLSENKRSVLISRVFQNPMAGTAADLSILENFRLAAVRTKSKQFKIGMTTVFRKLVAEKVVALNLGLENKLDQPMGALSGGQRQALTLLMSVMDETKLLLMDEPVSALDPRTADLVMQLAQKIITQYKLTVILVTHSMSDAHAYGTRIIQMAEGRAVKDLNTAGKKQISKEDLYGWF
jgi:putative tryptophan/tyrosine transport system ATP-binding protein